MKYHGIVIADLHVGAMSLERMHEEVSEMLLKEIKDSEELDYLIIAGDFFDYKFFLNSEASVMAYEILSEIIELCAKKGTKIRIVYGTESHENDQYSLINNFIIDDNIDIKVIKEVSDEELLPGLNVLYLPEEHITDKAEYYKDYFSNYGKYDYIFGHGIIREVTTDIARHAEETTSSKRLKVPVFTSAELGKICKGQVFFGHYHINQNVDDKFFSIGSFTRWKYGEDGPKGYYKLTCNPEKKKYEAKHIENTMAKTYTTISYGYNDNIFESEEKMQDALNRVDELLEDDVFDNVRFIFNIPDTIENPEATINYLKERFKSKENMKLEIQHGYIETKRNKQKEAVNTELEKYGFIKDPNLPLEEKCSRFISVEYNKDISPDEVKRLMMSDVTEIINEFLYMNPPEPVKFHAEKD